VEMLLRVMGDVRKRLAECLERNGGHLNDDDFCFQCVKCEKSKCFYAYIVFICVKTK